MKAQTPAWPVTPSDFVNSMSLTGQVVLDGNVVSTGANLLAAFVDGEIRGLATPTEIQGNDYYFLTIYSNVAQGETVKFRVWLEDEDAVFPVLDEVPFVKNSHVGSFSDLFGLQLSSDNDFPISLLPIPGDTTLSGYPFNPINLNEYLYSQDDDPVIWSVQNGANISGNLSADELTISPNVPNWTGTDSLLLTATEMGTANNYSASRYLVFTVNADYDPPLFGALPDQLIQDGQPMPSGNLNEQIIFAGPCLAFDFQMELPHGSGDQLLNWNQPNSGAGSMTILAQARYGGKPLPGGTYQLAAFVEGQLAGVASPQLMGGRLLYALTLSEIGTGPILFRLYDADRGYLHELPSQFNFSPATALGNFTVPVQLDFAPFTLTLNQAGVWSTQLLDENWTGEQAVVFSAFDCEYTDKNDEMSATFTTSPCTTETRIWTGNGDGILWSAPLNWTGNKLPSPCNNVVIPAGNMVRIEAGFDAFGKTLEVALGSEMEVEITGEISIGN